MFSFQYFKMCSQLRFGFALIFYHLLVIIRFYCYGYSIFHGIE